MMTAFLGLIVATRIFTVEAIHSQLEATLAANAGVRIAYTKITVRGEQQNDESNRS